MTLIVSGRLKVWRVYTAFSHNSLIISGICVCVSSFQLTLHLPNHTHMNCFVFSALACGSVSCGCQTSILTTLQAGLCKHCCSGERQRTRSAAAAVRMSSSWKPPWPHLERRFRLASRMNFALRSFTLSGPQTFAEMLSRVMLVFYSSIGCFFESVSLEWLLIACWVIWVVSVIWNTFVSLFSQMGGSFPLHWILFQELTNCTLVWIPLAVPFYWSIGNSPDHRGCHARCKPANQEFNPSHIDWQRLQAQCWGHFDKNTAGAGTEPLTLWLLDNLLHLMSHNRHTVKLLHLFLENFLNMVKDFVLERQKKEKEKRWCVLNRSTWSYQSRHYIIENPGSKCVLFSLLFEPPSFTNNFFMMGLVVVFLTDNADFQWSTSLTSFLPPP